jgi:hypothetical protein
MNGADKMLAGECKTLQRPRPENVQNQKLIERFRAFDGQV